MYGGYEPLADTAEIMGDIKLAKRLRKKGEKKMREIYSEDR